MTTIMQRFGLRTKHIGPCLAALVAISLPVSDVFAAGTVTATAPAASASQQLSPGEVPSGLGNNEWAGIQAQIAAGKYRAYAQEDGGFASANPAHGWNIHYAADGTTTLQPRDAAAAPYQVGLRLSAVGFTKLHALHQPRQVSANGNTVTYQWTNNLREWWVNSETGLEQWFELGQRPAGATAGQPLTLELTLASNLTASQTGNALGFSHPDGTTISYDKLKAWDATGRELPAQMQLAADRLSLLIDDQDASYPLTIDPTFQQQAYLKASNTGASDSFGISVALAGDTLVVGAFQEDSNATGVNGNQADNTASDSGAAYVFTRSGTTWSQQAYLKASNTGISDLFGISVALAGDTLVVGAYREDSNATGVNGNQADNTAGDSGAAYVFTRNGTNWSQQAYLKASNTGASDAFGSSVTLAGDTLVVAAHVEDSNATGVNGNQADNSALSSGAAYVFTRSGTNWSQQAYLKASNTGASDIFGSSVTLAGDTLVVGAYFEASNATGINGNQADNSALNSGAAYVFTRSGTNWSQQAYLKASNTGASDWFGISVALAGDTLVVGADLEDSNATGVNGNQADNSALSSGAAYVFTRSGTNWSQQAFLKASNTGTSDQFGRSVALAGDTLVVAAHVEDSNATGVNGNQADNSALSSGAAYVFTRSGTNWSQQAYLKASNTGGISDWFGISVALAGDTLVVGASGEDSNATGVNGNQADNSASDSGAAYVFDLVTLRRVIITSE